MRLPPTTKRTCRICGARATEAWWGEPGSGTYGDNRCDDHPARPRRWDLPSLGIPPVIDGPEVFDGPIDSQPVADQFDEVASAEFRAMIVREMVASLSPRDIRVAALRFSEELSFDEIGSMLGVTRERVRQLLARASRTMRGRRMIRRAFFAMTDLSGWRIDTVDR